MQTVRRPAGLKFDNHKQGYQRTYKLQGNVTQQCLYREGAVVTTYEQVFEVILEAQWKLKHARDT
jgi:hypothetical protein